MAQNRSIFATLPRTSRGMPLVLGGDPKGKTFLYPNGNSIIIRDIENPAVADIYTEHSTLTTVAKYSPSGFYIASGDQSGKIRIWDTTQAEHILKNEYQPFVGQVKDLSWSADNQRIVAVGEGRERFGAVFMADGGASVGEIAGHSKIINSCDFKPTRPFRIITGSEDNFVQIYEGPPFKFKHQLDAHTRFVQATRFSPNGELFATAGFDGKLFVFDSKEYSQIAQMKGASPNSPAHAGGIYALAWSPDGKQILTASGDKTCKLWDVESQACVTEFVMGNDLLDQQVSCLWQGKHLLSTSLSGFINYLDVNNPRKPLRIIKGHNKAITAMTVDTGSRTIYTGSHDGCITWWNADTGEQDRLNKSHSNQVQDMKTSSTTAVTGGLDDIVRFISLPTKEFVNLEIKMDSQPKGVAVMNGKDLVIVACYTDISIISAGAKQGGISVPYEPTSVDIHPQGQEIAVGGHKDSKVHVYTLMGANLTEKKIMEHRGSVRDVRYSPDGTYLAACDANRKIVLYLASTYEPAHTQEWGFHTATVNCLAWAPNSTLLASGGLDTAIIIWNTKEPSKHLSIKKAHPMSQITRVAWIDDETLVSCGQDANVKIWQVKFG